MAFRLSVVLLAVVCLVGCPPSLDPTLSPPLIDKPVYGCAEMIAFSGADRDAKIIVYVNGSKVTEVGTWIGWGPIKLPSPLRPGDVVAAAQVVGNRISEKTRDPVMVVASLPASPQSASW